MVSLRIILLIIVNTMIDSMYSSLLYVDNIVSTPIAKLSMLLRIEVWSYVMSIGMTPGRVTRHSRCTVSLLDNMEQLYDIVSIGQSMSVLAVFRSRRVSDANAE